MEYGNLEKEYNEATDRLFRLEAVSMLCDDYAGKSSLRTEDGNKVPVSDDYIDGLKVGMTTLGFTNDDIETFLKTEGGVFDDLTTKLKRLIKEEKHSLIVIYKRMNNKNVGNLKSLLTGLEEGTYEKAKEFGSLEKVVNKAALPLLSGMSLDKLETHKWLINQPTDLRDTLYAECANNISAMHTLFINNIKAGGSLLTKFPARAKESIKWLESISKLARVNTTDVVVAFPVNIFDNELSITYMIARDGEYAVHTKVIPAPNVKDIKPLEVKECIDLLNESLKAIDELNNKKYVQLASETNNILKFSLAKEFELLFSGLTPTSIPSYAGSKLVYSLISDTSRLKYNYGNAIKDLLGVGNDINSYVEAVVNSSITKK